MNVPKRIEIWEMAPRDGLQNVHDFVPTDVKFELIRKIVDAGASVIQITSFMSPKHVPQLRDAQEITHRFLNEFGDKVDYNVLVPNLKGAQLAYEAGARKASIVICVTESHNQSNVHRSVEQSFNEFENMIEAYPDMEFIQGMGSCFGCHWEGETPFETLISAIERGIKLGVKTFEFGDSIGVAYPTQIDHHFREFIKRWPEARFGAHIHDTRNMGTACTWAAILAGAHFVSSAVGGLGGCPFVPEAKGNVSTEDLVYMLDRCGVETGIDFHKILEAAKYAKQHVRGNFSSHQVDLPADAYPFF